MIALAQWERSVISKLIIVNNKKIEAESSASCHYEPFKQSPYVQYKVYPCKRFLVLFLNAAHCEIKKKNQKHQ